MIDNTLSSELRRFLFIRGFLLTNSHDVDTERFPFFGEWNHVEVCGYHFVTHPQTGFHYVQSGNVTAFILGHAYDPFTMEYDENKILERLASHWGKADFNDITDELTGIFILGIIHDGKVYAIVDPSGMQSACCGVVNDKFYLSSHPQMIADICGLEMDGFIKRLIAYKWYNRVMGPYLPADLTPFLDIKRIVPNIGYTFDGISVTHKRFYPVKEVSVCDDAAEYARLIEDAAGILKANMQLVSEKWREPWISLTGGIDSNTTFAAANGIYDRFHTFSYYSAEKEEPDWKAAECISSRFNVPWKLFKVPDDLTGLNDYAQKVEIINHNNGYVADAPANERRKRVYLEQNLPGDVEVKSWVSETIRAYWYKHYGRKSMPPLSARLFRNLYKIFLFNRPLAHEIDSVFERYIDEYEYMDIPALYLPADMHYNEVTWGSWGGLNISEMKFYKDITIIYNNRRFLDLMLRVPFDKRISDRHHLDLKKCLNKELYEMNIRVVNMRETAFRAFCLNVIFTINSILPF